MNYEAFKKKMKTKTFVQKCKSYLKNDIKTCYCDKIMFDLLSEYYKDCKNCNNVPFTWHSIKKQGLVAIKKRKKLDLRLEKFGMKKRKITLNEALSYNATSFGNINAIVEHCPTKRIVKIAENIIEQVLNILIDLSLEKQLSTTKDTVINYLTTHEYDYDGKNKKKEKVLTNVLKINCKLPVVHIRHVLTYLKKQKYFIK
jgi:hypothetical protein